MNKEIKADKTNKDSLISLTYDSFDTLISRKPYMTRSILNYLDRTSINKEIKDVYTSITEDSKYILNFVLTPIIE